MKILYVGNFGPSHSTENHLAASLRALGHDVRQAQEDALAIPRLNEMSWDADCFLWTRTWGLLGGERREDMRWVQELSTRPKNPIPTVSYHLDLYRGLPRGDRINQDAFFRTNHVFTPDGGSDEYFRHHGVNHHYMKPGVYGEECYLAPADDRFRCDVTFVGSEGYHPIWSYRPRLVRWLRQNYGRRFQKHGSPQDCVRGDDLNRLYASAKVVVGDSLCLNFDHPAYWSDRVYETLGRGGFLIHPYIKGMEDEFVDGEHLVYYQFGDFNQLRRLVDYYVAHDEEREAIRQRGHDFVKASCTYVHRMQQMLGVLAEHEPRIAEKLG